MCDFLHACTQTSNVVVAAPMASTACEECQVIVNLADQELKNPDVDTAITTKLEALCGSNAECKSLVSTYVPKLLNYVADIGAQQVCTAVHMCQA